MQNYAKYYALLGQNVACYRKKRCLTQEGLALQANVPRTHISHIEAAGVQKQPSLDILFPLCGMLRIEPYQLLCEQSEMDN